jgi:hypothetical protein
MLMAVTTPMLSMLLWGLALPLGGSDASQTQSFSSESRGSNTASVACDERAMASDPIAAPDSFLSSAKPSALPAQTRFEIGRAPGSQNRQWLLVDDHPTVRIRAASRPRASSSSSIYLCNSHVRRRPPPPLPSPGMALALSAQTWRTSALAAHAQLHIRLHARPSGWRAG